MAAPIVISYTFATESGNVPAAQLDTNFSQAAAALNALASFSNYFVDSGVANAIQLTVNTPLTVSYNAGLALQILVAATNTGATTIQVNSLGTVALVTGTHAVLSAGAIAAGMLINVQYDGTRFILLSQGTSTGTSPGGSNTQVQYNNSGVFGGSANFVWNGAGLAVTGGLSATAFIVNSGNTASGATADLAVNRNGSTANQLEQGPNAQLFDLTNQTGTVLQQSGGQTEIWAYNSSWLQLAYWSASGGLTLNAPRTGATLVVTGAASYETVNINSGTSGTVSLPDLLVERAGSTINAVLQGPGIQFADTTGGTSSALQQSGGQTEIWQYNGGTWRRNSWWDTNNLLHINDSAGAGYLAGFLGTPLNSQSTSYVAALSDRGKSIEMTTTSTVTMPANVFSSGDVLTIVAGYSTTITVAQGAGMTLTWANGNTMTGNRTLTGAGMATVLWLSATSAFITGTALS